MKVIAFNNQYTIKSEYSVEQLEKVARFSPDDLVLVNAVSNEPVFKIAVDRTGGGLTKKILCFAENGNDGKACLTRTIPSGDGNIKSRIANDLGMALVYGKQIEDGLDSVIETIGTNESNTMELITIIE